MLQIDFFYPMLFVIILILIVIFLIKMDKSESRTHILHKLNFNNWFKIAKKKNNNYAVQFSLNTEDGQKIQKIAKHIIDEEKQLKNDIEDLRDEFLAVQGKNVALIQSIEKHYSEKIYQLKEQNKILRDEVLELKSSMTSMKGTCKCQH